MADLALLFTQPVTACRAYAPGLQRPPTRSHATRLSHALSIAQSYRNRKFVRDWAKAAQAGAALLSQGESSWALRAIFVMRRTRWSSGYGRVPALAAGLLLAMLLSGCLLMSGEQTSFTRQEGISHLRTAFVSAEGETVRTIQVAEGPAAVQVVVIATLASGDLQLDLLHPDNTVAFTVIVPSNTQVTRTARVQASDQGYIRYRVAAREARDGSYQLLMQKL